jgi:hypothetical protein
MDRLNFLFTEYPNVSAGAFVDTGDDYHVTGLALVPSKAGYTVYVLRVLFMFSVPDHTITWKIVSGAITNQPVFSSLATRDPAGAADTPGPVLSADFGPDGIPLTAGEALNLYMSAAGAAGTVYVEAYQRIAPNA